MGSQAESSKEKALKKVRRNGFALQILDEAHKADPEVVLAAVEHSGHALLHAAGSLLSNRDFIMKVVQRSGVAMQHVPTDLKSDKEVALTACKTWGYALRYVSDILKANKEVVMTAITGAGNALRYASSSMQADKEVVDLALANSNGGALDHVSQDMIQDVDFLSEVESKYGQAGQEKAFIVVTHADSGKSCTCAHPLDLEKQQAIQPDEVMKDVLERLELNGAADSARLWRNGSELSARDISSLEKAKVHKLELRVTVAEASSSP
mmetsp:Transcript_19098/g.44671  ORF Transcript_19098/g.44671 Transcript_19098/m.44671 type:complete len:266 (-) Transcript_19098:129-926(-)